MTSFLLYHYVLDLNVLLNSIKVSLNVIKVLLDSIKVLLNVIKVLLNSVKVSLNVIKVLFDSIKVSLKVIKVLLDSIKVFEILSKFLRFYLFQLYDRIYLWLVNFSNVSSIPFQIPPYIE